MVENAWHRCDALGRGSRDTADHPDARRFLGSFKLRPCRHSSAPEQDIENANFPVGAVPEAQERDRECYQGRYLARQEFRETRRTGRCRARPEVEMHEMLELELAPAYPTWL